MIEKHKCSKSQKVACLEIYQQIANNADDDDYDDYDDDVGDDNDDGGDANDDGNGDDDDVGDDDDDGGDDDDDDSCGLHCIPPMGCICKMPPRREIYIYK